MIKNTFCEVANSNAGDRNLSFRQSCFRADSTGGSDGTLEQGMSDGTTRTLSFRDAVGFANLIHDLRFTQDHAIERRDHFEQVSDRFRTGSGSQFADKLVQRHVVKFGQELCQKWWRQWFGVGRSSDVQFDSITSRKDNRFSFRKTFFQARVCGGQSFGRSKCQPFADRKGCRLMCAVKSKQVHGARPCVAASERADAEP